MKHLQFYELFTFANQIFEGFSQISPQTMWEFLKTIRYGLIAKVLLPNRNVQRVFVDLTFYWKSNESEPEFWIQVNHLASTILSTFMLFMLFKYFICAKYSHGFIVRSFAVSRAWAPTWYGYAFKITTNRYLFYLNKQLKAIWNAFHTYKCKQT